MGPAQILVPNECLKDIEHHQMLLTGFRILVYVGRQVATCYMFWYLCTSSPAMEGEQSPARAEGSPFSKCQRTGCSLLSATMQTWDAKCQEAAETQARSHHGLLAPTAGVVKFHAGI